MSSSSQRLLSIALRGGVAAILFLLAMGWSGLWLAGKGQFAASTTWMAGLVAAGLGWRFSAPLLDAIAPFSRRELLAGAVLLILAVVPNLRQGELILGGWDPGVYLHTAAAVDRGGSVKMVDPDLAALTPEERIVVARDLFGVVEPFGGMRVLPSGETSPSFHHAYPCLMASVWPLGGLTAALWVNPLFHVGSVFLIAWLSGLLWGRTWAWPAGFLLALNPAQIWQAGFPTAEASTQFFLLAAALFLVLSQERKAGGWFAAVLSSLFFGFALLIRYDSILLLVPVFLILLAGLPGAMHPGRIALQGAVLILPVLHFRHIQNHVAPYYHPVSGMVVDVLGVVVAVMAVWLVVRWIFRKSIQPHTGQADQVFRGLLIAGLMVWLVVFGVLRPMLAGSRDGVEWLAGLLGREHAFWSVMTGPDAGNLFHLVAFMGWPGFALFLVGLFGAVWQTHSLPRRALLYGAVVSLIIITIHVFNDHFLMWVSRRFIPVIVPLMVIAATGTLALLARRAGTRWPALVSGLAVIVITAFTARDSLYLARHRDWPGLIAWYERVEQAIPDGVTVFCDQPGFAAPLRYLYGHRSYEVHRREPDARERLAVIMRERLDRGESVYFFTMKGAIDGEGLESVPVSALPLDSFIVQDTLRWIPSSLKGRGGDFVLFHITRTP